MFFFCCGPFLLVPRVIGLRIFFAVGPGCAKCFFFVALRWAPRPFGGARAKKKTPPRVFFLLRPRGKAGEGEAPLGAGTGPEQKNNTTQGVFFFFVCCGPGERQGKEKPRWKPARGQSKKKNTTQGFFALAPCRRPTGLLLPLPFPGAGAKKKHPGWCFFFCCGPARTLTHSLRAWVAMPPPRRGGVFFLLRPRPDRGGVLFAVVPPGRSLTHGGLGRFRQGPGGVFFFAAAPPGLFRQ